MQNLFLSGNDPRRREHVLTDVFRSFLAPIYCFVAGGCGGVQLAAAQMPQAEDG